MTFETIERPIRAFEFNAQSRLAGFDKVRANAADNLTAYLERELIDPQNDFGS